MACRGRCLRKLSHQHGSGSSTTCFFFGAHPNTKTRRASMPLPSTCSICKPNMIDFAGSPPKPETRPQLLLPLTAAPNHLSGSPRPPAARWPIGSPTRGRCPRPVPGVNDCCEGVTGCDDCGCLPYRVLGVVVGLPRK